MTATALLVSGLLALAAAAVTFLLLQRNLNNQAKNLAILDERLLTRQAELQAKILNNEQLQNQIVAQQNEMQGTRAHVARLEAELGYERKQFSEKLQLLNDSRAQMAAEFKNLANEILEDKSKRFTLSNQENITQILKPLQEKIQNFEKRVEETYNRESKERFSLTNEIKNLQELNQRISVDAVNLTNALKGDNKAQGAWGEFILESILEKSGLVRGREYDVQVSMKAVDGSRSQPDVVVHLPESRDIVIDSKVSLKSYEAYCSESNAEERAEHLRQHIQSIRGHVKSLSAKDYQNLTGVNSLDFVLLFMPVEAAFSVAAQQDGELFHAAFEKNIIIVGPSTLLTTLRTVQNIWRLAQQNQNALEIAAKAGALYDKFVAFVADLEELGSKLDGAQKSYEKAHNKLRSGKGNLITRTEKIKQLGARTSKKHRDGLLQNAELGTHLDALPDHSEKD